MTHARQQIREAVESILSSHSIGWKSVLLTRIPPTRQIWPYVMVYTPSDEPVSETPFAPSVHVFNCDLVIDARLRLPGTGDTSEIEERLDAVGFEIQEKVTFQSLFSHVSGIKSLSAPRTVTEVLTGEDDIDYGQIVLSYTVGYSTLEGSPGSLL